MCVCFMLLFSPYVVVESILSRMMQAEDRKKIKLSVSSSKGVVEEYCLRVSRPGPTEPELLIIS